MKNQDKHFYVAFGERIRRFRKAREMTQADLADRLSLSRTSITNVECGNQQVLLHQLPAFCAALGVSADDLLPDTTELNVEDIEKLLPQVEGEEMHTFLRSIITKR